MFQVTNRYWQLSYVFTISGFLFFFFLKNDGVCFFLSQLSPFWVRYPMPVSSHAAQQQKGPQCVHLGPSKEGWFFFFFVQFIYCLWLGESKISLHWSILAVELVFFFFKGFCFQFKPSPFCSRCISVFMRVQQT